MASNYHDWRLHELIAEKQLDVHENSCPVTNKSTNHKPAAAAGLRVHEALNALKKMKAHGLQTW